MLNFWSLPVASYLRIHTSVIMRPEVRIMNFVYCILIKCVWWRSGWSMMIMMMICQKMSIDKVTELKNYAFSTCICILCCCFLSCFLHYSRCSQFTWWFHLFGWWLVALQLDDEGGASCANNIIQVLHMYIYMHFKI